MVLPHRHEFPPPDSPRLTGSPPARKTQPERPPPATRRSLGRRRMRGHQNSPDAHHTLPASHADSDHLATAQSRSQASRQADPARSPLPAGDVSPPVSRRRGPPRPRANRGPPAPAPHRPPDQTAL